MPFLVFMVPFEIHPLLSFTMELEDNGKLPFLAMVIIRNVLRLDTKVYVKPNDTALLLYYQSHIDQLSTNILNCMTTMFKPAFKLSGLEVAVLQ